MERYENYRLEDFLMDDEFRKWADSGAPLSGTPWENIIWLYPDKKEAIEKAALLSREWKKRPSSLSDNQLRHDIDQILAGIEKKEKALRPQWSGWMRYAAVLLLAVAGIGYYWSNRSVSTFSPPDAVAKRDLIEVFNSAKEDQTITLPDGSTVILSPGSQITYSDRFSNELMRNVNLMGAAFFDVKRDTLRPFSVYTGKIITRVLGTSFTIRSGIKDVSVTVNTGKVAVLRDDEKSEELLLTPNQKAVYLDSAQTLTKMLAEVPVLVAGPDLAVQNGFDETPASAVFRTLERAYGISIQFDEKMLEECYVTLPFREEPFYQKLDILCRTIKATYEVTNNGIVIKSAGCK